MFLLFVKQQNCGPCAKAEPVVKSICKSIDLEFKEIDVTEDWDLAVKLGAYKTPTLFLINEDSQTSVEIPYVNPVQLRNTLLDVLD